MRKDIKKLMEFVNTTQANNLKCGKETKLEISYSFFGGKMSMCTRPENMDFGDDYITVENDFDDPSEFALSLEITDKVKISIDNNAKTFAITNIGVTGILDKRIEGKLVREAYL